jgi:outer membrane protein OmpA-like peptidoglycan-associated protein/opacity protein-like surface antigen
MRKLAIAAALSTTVLAGPALARDGAWYVGGDFGPMIVEDIEANFTPGATAGSTGISQIDFDEGFDGSVFVGYDLGAFRIEAEVAYKSADIGGIGNTSIAFPGLGAGGASGTFRGDGDVSVLSGMVNGLLDFGDDDGLSGFVGGGVGLARVDLSAAAFTNSAAAVDDSDTRFAWQVLAGVRQALTPNIDLHLKYRFFNVDNIQMTGFGGRAVDTDLRSHSLLGGITFNFGAPVIVDDCLAPNFLDANGVCTAPVEPIVCPPGTQLSGDSCVAIEQPPEVIYTDCPDGTRVVQGQQCPTITIPPAIVFFDWDKDTLTDEARRTLNTVSENYRRGGQTQVVLAGHADRSGSDAYNVGLSQRRANRVRDYLTTQGVPGGSMTTQAFGEERPRVETADGVREPDNRRVEITFGPGSGW